MAMKGWVDLGDGKSVRVGEITEINDDGRSVFVYLRNYTERFRLFITGDELCRRIAEAEEAKPVATTAAKQETDDGAVH